MATVIVFTTPTCPHCKAAKEFLREKSIPFEEKDVTRDIEARAELIRRKVTAVPSFLIGEELIIGFDKNRILELNEKN